MLDVKNLISKTCILYLHKTLTYKIPRSIYNLFLPKNIRNTDHIIRTKYKPKSKKLSKHVIYRSAQMYNALPNVSKSLKINKQINNYVYIRIHTIHEIFTWTVSLRISH